VLTRHGRGVAVLLSLESFEEMADQLAETELREALDEGEADIRAGRVHTHATVVAKYTNRPNGQG
jgi:PHD/YefM family antitoxin component YafN of YafNO toxin-antitoxin module